MTGYKKLYKKKSGNEWKEKSSYTKPVRNKKELKGRIPDLESHIFDSRMRRGYINMSKRTLIRGVILNCKKMLPNNSWILHESKPRPWTKESNRCSDK